MELVDANTKNYVFLTLSQYNDKQKLVRTRVSMRRDQPFWDGGNSYICCESFRVSSSPSQGGLYYKIFPPEWYMGCSIENNEPDMPAADSFSRLAYPYLGPAQHERGTICGFIDAEYSEETHLSTAQIYPVGVLADDSTSLLNTQDPTLVQTALTKFANHYKLTKGAWTRFMSDGLGADGMHHGWYQGRLSFSPSITLTGNGFGPQRLYYPEVKFHYPATQVSWLTDLAAKANWTDARGSSIEAIILLYPQSNMAAEDVTDEEKEIVDSNVGAGMSVQIRTSEEVPYLWEPRIYGEFLKVMGLIGCEYNAQNQFFKPKANNPSDLQYANQTTAPNRQMLFNTLKVGETCWIDIKENDPDFTQGRYYGTITKIPNLQKVEGYWAYNSYCEPSQKLFDLVKTGWANNEQKRTLLLEQCFMFTYDHNPPHRGISCLTEFEVKESHNLDPIGGDAATNKWDFEEGFVHQAPEQYHTDERMCVRRPGVDGPRYLYTPNEMFYAFNKKEKELDLPYKLQTDENGGFVIKWKDDSNTPGTNFTISLALSQELGLNEYFEYETETYVNNHQSDKFFLLKKDRRPWVQDQRITAWIDRSDLSTTNPVRSNTNNMPAWTPAPIQPVAGFVEGEAPELYDRAGNQYSFVFNHQFTRNRYVSETARIYPTIHEDDDGVAYFDYSDLPVSGRIGNTQMVSVESFSTYSEITIVIPNLPFQSMLGTSSDERILASLRLPFQNGTGNNFDGEVTNTTFSYYGDLIFNTLASRSYLKVTTDQQLYDCDVEVRLIRRDGQMDVMKLPYKGEFQVKLRLLQTQ